MNWEAIGAVGEILGAISGESRRLNPINSDTVCTVRSELLQVIIVNAVTQTKLYGSPVIFLFANCLFPYIRFLFKVFAYNRDNAKSLTGRRLHHAPLLDVRDSCRS